MKLRLLTLLALPYIALGQSVGDIIIQKATASGATEVYVTPSPTKILGLNDSGEPSLISLGSGVTLPSGTLTINPAWSAIISTPTTLSGYGITDGVTSSGLTTILGDYLTTATAASTYALAAHNQAWSTITSTPTTLSGYGITDAQGLDATLTALAGAGTSGTFPYFSATDTVAEATITAAGRNFLAQSTGALQRSQIGLANLLPYTPSFLWASPVFANTYPIQVGNGLDVSVTMESTGVTWEQDTNLLGVLSADALTDGRIWTLPDATGTIALTSDLAGYLTSATAASTYQPLDTQLTALSGISYTSNAGKFIRVNAGETGFELATVSGSGTVTSVALSAPTGLAVTGSPITTTGTLALSYDAGYQGYTTSEASKLAGIEAGADVTDATNVAAAGAVMVGGALGTPSSGTMTNVSGTAASLTAGNATAAEGLKSATTTVVVSGATAPTSGQVLTATSSTAANWQTPSGGGGSTVYTIMAQHGQTLTWADGATYYFGAQYGRTSTITSGGKCSIPIVRTGTITKIALRTYSLTAGSSESWEFFIRVNDTTDTSLGTVATSANARDWNATVSIAVTAGDFIEFKTVCPTWATNPVNNSLIATIYIEE